MSARLLLALALAVLGLRSASAEGFAAAKGGRVVGPDGKEAGLRGMSLGNWLVPEGYMLSFDTAVAPRQIEAVFAELVGPEEARAFWTAYRDAYVTKEDLRYLRTLGFDLVRVPFNAKLLNPEDRPEVWDEREFRRLEDVVAWAKEAGLLVVLDMHVAHGGQTGANIDDSTGTPWLFESEESRRRAVEVWRRLARRFKGETAVLGYELLNEPIASHSDVKRYGPMLEPLYRRMVEAIRESDPDHLVILGGAQWNSDFSFFGPPFDPKSVYAFHRYWTPTGDAIVKEFVDFRARHKIPVWMGESGENSDEWIAAFRKTLERNRIPWAFWPHKKMEGTSGVLRFEKPPYWDEVRRYADGPWTSYEEKRAARPSLEHARAALAGLLENVRLERCRANRGYIEALGLRYAEPTSGTPSGGRP